MKVQEYVEKLEQDHKKTSEEIETLKKLSFKFSDLEIIKNRWGNIKYYSKIVNKLANNFYSDYSCGCCDDAALQIYFYYEYENVRIYTNPEYISIGHKTHSGDDLIDFDFEQNLLDSDINKDIVQKVISCYNNPCKEIEV